MKDESGDLTTDPPQSAAAEPVDLVTLSDWLAPFTVRAVWVRAAKVALPVGFLQDCVNQGEFWLRGEFSQGVILRTLLTPLISLVIGLLAAASTYRLARQPPPACARTLRPS